MHLIWHKKLDLGNLQQFDCTSVVTSAKNSIKNGVYVTQTEKLQTIDVWLIKNSKFGVVSWPLFNRAIKQKWTSLPFETHICSIDRDRSHSKWWWSIENLPVLVVFRLIINESLEVGSMLPYIQKCNENGWAVVVMNTNDNEYFDSNGHKFSKKVRNHCWYHRHATLIKTNRLERLERQAGGINFFCNLTVSELLNAFLYLARNRNFFEFRATLFVGSAIFGLILPLIK